MRNGRKHEGSASYRMNHRQHPDVIQSVAVAYAVLFLKLENIGLNKIKVSEMGKYFDVLRIICHTEKKRRNGVTPEQMMSSTGFLDDVTV